MVRLSTRYPKAVVSVPESPPSSGLFVLKESSTNKKLGKGGSVVTKGRFRGKRLYGLTLEERATCWSGCPNLGVCYGDNMPFAKRYEPGPQLEQAIAEDVALLARRHQDGFVIRLHVLGDFYSEAYVEHWAYQLYATPTLYLFGYTHWPHEHPIGRAVANLASAWPDRVAFRRSDRTSPADPLPAAITIPRGADAAPGTIICPEQTGRTASCTTCGLCMDQRLGVSFIDHSRAGLPVLLNAA